MAYDEDALIQEYRADHRRITNALVKTGLPEDIASIAAQSQIMEIQTTSNNLLMMVAKLTAENPTYQALNEEDKIMVVHRHIDEVAKRHLETIHAYTEDIFKKSVHKAKCEMEVRIAVSHGGGL
jgi:hypothetical protein